MFSKYDVYTTTQSIYCYPDTNVLKNKLNIRDNKLLKTAEEEITLIKQMELLKNPIKGNFSKSHLMNIHKFIFEDIYLFAGKIRQEQISKADTMFYPPNLINRELDKVFLKIKEQNMLNEKEEEKIFDNLAYVMAELNIIHPFREGNGRTIREFIRLLAKRLNYDLNWGNVDKEDLLEASITSIDNYKVLVSILKVCIE
ncbi:MAG: cell filamentation protein Fic [Ruminococcaceae bacterium]|nr:cell filamentation protein Fic [Oscillospiraceae bacterium]